MLLIKKWFKRKKLSYQTYLLTNKRKMAASVRYVILLWFKYFLFDSNVLPKIFSVKQVIKLWKIKVVGASTLITFWKKYLNNIYACLIAAKYWMYTNNRFAVLSNYINFSEVNSNYPWFRNHQKWLKSSVGRDKFC